MSKAILFAALIPALAVLAQVEPQEPAPGNVYNQGTACSIVWAKDTTGTWTTMNIELMTGANDAMVHLTTVGTVDGTKDTTFSYTCPEVSPNSAIYFYQFSSPAAPTNLTWTGRFAIADASGKTTDPTDTSADGIKFGTGALADPSSASPAPSYLGGTTSSATGSAAAANSSVPLTTTTAGPAGTTASVSVTGALTLTTSVRSTVTHSGAANANQVSGSGSGSAPASSSTTSGASAFALDIKTRSLQALAGLVATAAIFTTVF